MLLRAEDLKKQEQLRCCTFSSYLSCRVTFFADTIMEIHEPMTIAQIWQTLMKQHHSRTLKEKQHSLSSCLQRMSDLGRNRKWEDGERKEDGGRKQKCKQWLRIAGKGSKRKKKKIKKLKRWKMFAMWQFTSIKNVEVYNNKDSRPWYISLLPWINPILLANMLEVEKTLKEKQTKSFFLLKSYTKTTTFRLSMLWVVLSILFGFK